MLFCNRFITMIRAIILLAIIALAFSAPAEDLISPRPPGYDEKFNTSVYSGYLDVGSTTRAIHYVFVESIHGANNTDPLTLWLNGGPGCSSLLGYLQEIGPYYLQQGIDYKRGEMLTQNPHSWHKVSNLLFIESPTEVGYSYNNDTTFEYNDATTAHDNLNALLSFFKKFKEYQGRKFYIAGQSYAGKYIPDLAVLIDGHNLRGEDININLKAILVGNGVMSFSTLQDSTYQFTIARRFVDPQIVHVYESACRYDPESAGCRFFQIEYEKGTEELNPYNVYSYCYYNDSFAIGNEVNKRRYRSQQSILSAIKRQLSGAPPNEKFNGAPCAYFDGIFDYFNLNEEEYHAKFKGQKWNGPCAENIRYKIDPKGSMDSYRHLVGLLPTSRKIALILYNGNWDSVVPYGDTLKGLDLLDLTSNYVYGPWWTEGQHSGFEQVFSGVNLIIFKGASHQVPQSKRPQSLKIFTNILTKIQDGSYWQTGVVGDFSNSVTQSK